MGQTRLNTGELGGVKDSVKYILKYTESKDIPKVCVNCKKFETALRL